MVVVWVGLALHNRAIQIDSLKAQLGVQGEKTKQAAADANANAQAVLDLQKRLDDTTQALAVKADHDEKLAATVSELQNEVKHASPSTCVSPAILTVIAGVRHLQSGGCSVRKGAGGSCVNSSGVVVNLATAGSASDPNQAALAISKWIADLYQHDTTCVNDLTQIQQLEAK